MITKRAVSHVVHREICEITCELCKKKALNGDERSSDWHENSYEVAETAIYMKTGRSYPEGGSGEYRSLPICVDCFESKIIPTLEALGVKFQEIEWDF